MNIHFGNQSQFELFPGTTGEPIENSAPRFIFSRVTLTFENVIVVSVFFIVSLIIAYSVGVERGRARTRVAHAVAQPVAVPTAPTVMPETRLPALPPGRITFENGRQSAVSFSGTAVAAPEPVVVRQSVAPAPPPRAVIPSPVGAEKSIDKSYTVQVASYKNQADAQREADQLKKRGFESFTMIKGDFVILCVGRFSGMEEARETQAKLKARFKDSIVRSL